MQWLDILQSLQTLTAGFDYAYPALNSKQIIITVQ